jgi:hypothetical protein
MKSKKKNNSAEDKIGNDFPTKKDLIDAQRLAQRISPMMLDLLEAEEIPEKENADSV